MRIHADPDPQSTALVKRLPFAQPLDLVGVEGDTVHGERALVTHPTTETKIFNSVTRNEGTVHGERTLVIHPKTETQRFLTVS